MSYFAHHPHVSSHSCNRETHQKNAVFAAHIICALTFLFITIAANGLMIGTAHHVQAQEVDFSYTINLAGKQRMLSQKMAKEALLVALEINKEENLSNLKASHALFDKTLKGLQNGDTDLSLAPVNNPKIQTQLDTVIDLWTGYSGAVQSLILAGAINAPQIDTIANLNIPVLIEMDRAVKFYEDEAASGDLSPALAKAINISGRQRMLSQKMSKEFFFIALGKNVDANKANLAKTIALFDSSLDGLINGSAELGLSHAPTPELKAQLDIVNGLWGEFRTAIEGAPTSGNIAVIAEKNLPLLMEMNKAVGMFEAL